MNPHAHIDIIISEQMLTPSQLEVIRKLAFVVVFNVFCQNSEFEQFL
jgi:Na+-translocating ferredoxin:NAD+ oxidoreductase RnfA subunit